MTVNHFNVENIFLYTLYHLFTVTQNNFEKNLLKELFYHSFNGTVWIIQISKSVEPIFYEDWNYILRSYNLLFPWVGQIIMFNIRNEKR